MSTLLTTGIMGLYETKLEIEKASAEKRLEIILNRVLEMTARGDSKETIFETVKYLKQ
jgi:hypothetical protein